MEFKLRGKKKIWMVVSNKKVKPCEAQMMEHLYKGGALCFAVVHTPEDQNGDDDPQPPLHIQQIVERYKRVMEVPTQFLPSGVVTIG